MPLDDWPRGTISGLLEESYSVLLDDLPPEKVSELRRDWDDYDESVILEADTVGAAGFMTLLDGDPVGFGSWDPRRWPEVGRVGHNCIIPEHQRRGYGRLQVEEILRRLRALGFARIQVRTDEHPFFEAARRIYDNCGFRVVGYEPGVLLPGYRMLVYELQDSGSA